MGKFFFKKSYLKTKLGKKKRTLSLNELSRYRKICEKELNNLKILVHGSLNLNDQDADTGAQALQW